MHYRRFELCVDALVAHLFIMGIFANSYIQDKGEIGSLLMEPLPLRAHRYFVSKEMLM